MGKTLSIETGIRCSNRCSFCYQSGWRCDPSLLPDPSYETLAEKLAWGRANGYDSVGFSGGEPTVRKDFVALVREAARLGYGQVSLTTNGRRFSDGAYAAELLDAGLTGIGWSLHGPDARTHDGLVGRDGAFEQVRSGLRNVAQLAADRGVKLRQNLFVLVNRVNAGRIAEIGRLASGHGIRLVVLQPVIYSKANLSVAAGLALELPDLVAAVRAAAEAGRKVGTFIKLFNLAPCFFTDMLDAFEHQRYPVEVFRYQETKRAGESRVVAGQGYVRLDRCAECLLQGVCPGVHQSLVPQGALLEMALGTMAPGRPGSVPWVGGTELMREATLTRFLIAVRGKVGADSVKLYVGADGVAGDRVVPAAVAGGAREICLVTRAGEAGSTDLSFRSRGSAAGAGAPAESRLAGAGALAASRLAGPGSFCALTLSVPFYVDPPADLWQRLVRDAGSEGWGLEIALPWDFKRPEAFDAVKLVRQSWRWRAEAHTVVSVAVPDSRRSGGLLFRGLLKASARVANAANHWAGHFFAGPLAGWIGTSTPPFVRAAADADHGAGAPVLSGIEGRPVDRRMLEQMRQG